MARIYRCARCRLSTTLGIKPIFIGHRCPAQQNRWVTFVEQKESTDARA